jgi:hypothetical protein
VHATKFKVPLAGVAGCLVLRQALAESYGSAYWRTSGIEVSGRYRRHVPRTSRFSSMSRAEVTTTCSSTEIGSRGGQKQRYNDMLFDRRQVRGRGVSSRGNIDLLFDSSGRRNNSRFDSRVLLSSSSSNEEVIGYRQQLQQ